MHRLGEPVSAPDRLFEIFNSACETTKPGRCHDRPNEVIDMLRVGKGLVAVKCYDIWPVRAVEQVRDRCQVRDRRRRIRADLDFEIAVSISLDDRRKRSRQPVFKIADIRRIDRIALPDRVPNGDVPAGMKGRQPSVQVECGEVRAECGRYAGNIGPQSGLDRDTVAAANRHPGSHDQEERGQIRRWFRIYLLLFPTRVDLDTSLQTSRRRSLDGFRLQPDSVLQRARRSR